MLCPSKLSYLKEVSSKNCYILVVLSIRHTTLMESRTGELKMMLWEHIKTVEFLLKYTTLNW